MELPFSVESGKDENLVDEDLRTVISLKAGSGKSSFIFNLFNDTTLDFFMNQTKQEKLQVEELLKSKKNVVVLGKPGAGKSSLVKHLMIHILSKQSEDIPIRVELHKYNHEKKQGSIGFIEYIYNQLRSEHQINKLIREDIVNFLTNHQVIIFFDGMDEILDVQERISVRNDIENIVNQYKSLKCIVTSRFESYDEVFFNEQQFDLFEVNDFDDEQIKEFVHKWYEIEESNTILRLREVNSCLKELQVIEDELKRNPLLLTLIVILYRNELELPTSKLDVYESCTLTLVDTRDNKRKN